MIREDRAPSVASDRSVSPSRIKVRPAGGYGFDPGLEISAPETRVLDTPAGAFIAAGQWRSGLIEQLGLIEEERQRIAADLHDGLGQSLCLLSRLIRTTVSLVDGSDSQIDQHLNQIMRTVDGMLTELRRTAMNLRPSMLDDLGLLATLSWYFREIKASAPAVEIDRRIRVAEADIPESVKTALFRIVQEAFTNALKHAQARRLRVMMTKRHDRLQLSIQDDGKGFELDHVLADKARCGYGLRSMQARADGSGGRFLIASGPGQGTRIQVYWPSLCKAAAA